MENICDVWYGMVCVRCMFWCFKFVFIIGFFVLILILLVKMRVCELKWLKVMVVVEGCGSGWKLCLFIIFKEIIIFDFVYIRC